MPERKTIKHFDDLEKEMIDLLERAFNKEAGDAEVRHVATLSQRLMKSYMTRMHYAAQHRIDIAMPFLDEKNVSEPA